MEIPEWHSADSEPAFAIMACTLGFVFYWFLSHSEGVKKRMLENYGEEKTKIRYILFQKYTGVTFLGIIPAIIALIWFGKTPADYALTWNGETWLTSLYWILGLGAVVIPMNFFATRRDEAQQNYPQIRVKEWSRSLVISNAFGWIAYLFAYEFLFRGILLYGCLELGVWPAIMINLALYSATHIPKGFTESIGALPLGFLLCLITLDTGTFWVAFIVHVFLALSNDYFALYHQKDMFIKRS